MSTQQNTVLTTTTFPCTITGLRWVVSAAASAGTALSNVVWAIVVVHDLASTQNLQTGDGNELYSPEKQCLVWGRSVLSPNDQSSVYHVEGSTKTMRKFQGGDRLFFVAVAEVTNTVELHAIVQFFCMT